MSQKLTGAYFIYPVDWILYVIQLLGPCQANLCFHFAGSGENLPDIAKSRDASMDNKEFSSIHQILMKQSSFLFWTTSCHFSVKVSSLVMLAVWLRENHEESSSQVSLD